MAKSLKQFFIACPENGFKPACVSSSFLFWYMFMLVFLHIIPILFFIYLPKNFMFADITKAAIIRLTNRERQTVGLIELQSSPILDQAAQAKAKDMLSKGYFAHESPQGLTPWFWFKQAGYNYLYAGENLAIGFLEPEEVYKGWTDSFTHHQNLLSPNYSEIGVAVLSGEFEGRKTTIVVQMFGQQKGLKFTPVQTKTLPKNMAPAENAIKKIPEKTAAAIADLSPRVAGQRTAQFFANSHDSPSPSTQESRNFRQEIFNFLIFSYNDFLKNLTLYSLAMICAVFLLNLHMFFEPRNKQYIFQALFFAAVLIIFAMFNKSTLIELIPHSFSIE